MDDVISRKMAIDAMGKAMWAKERLADLPPAQPEPCEDTVSREKINNFCHEVIKRDPDGGNDVVKVFNAFRAYVNSLPSVTPKQPEIIRCKDCRHNHDCNIQYHAQAGEEFYCGAAERRTDE